MVVAIRFHEGNRRQHRNGGLTDRDHMRVAAEQIHHRNQVVDIVVEIERPSLIGTMRASTHSVM